MKRFYKPALIVTACAVLALCSACGWLNDLQVFKGEDPAAENAPAAEGAETVVEGELAVTDHYEAVCNCVFSQPFPSGLRP